MGGALVIEVVARPGDATLSSHWRMTRAVGFDPTLPVHEEEDDEDDEDDEDEEDEEDEDASLISRQRIRIPRQGEDDAPRLRGDLPGRRGEEEVGEEESLPTSARVENGAFLMAAVAGVVAAAEDMAAGDDVARYSPSWARFAATLPAEAPVEPASARLLVMRDLAPLSAFVASFAALRRRPADDLEAARFLEEVCPRKDPPIVWTRTRRGNVPGDAGVDRSVSSAGVGPSRASKAGGSGTATASNKFPSSTHESDWGGEMGGMVCSICFSPCVCPPNVDLVWEHFSGLRGQRLGTSRHNGTSELQMERVARRIACFSDGQVRVLPCGHVFHARCIDAWLIPRYATYSQFGCPLCRKIVS